MVGFGVVSVLQAATRIPRIFPMPLGTNKPYSLTSDIQNYQNAVRSRSQGKSDSDELPVWSSVLDSKYPRK